MNDPTGPRVDEEWMAQAACLGEDPDLFFPVSSTGPGLAQVEEAKEVCGRCPVRDECLAYALATGQTSGIWGGLTEAERLILLRRRPRPARPAPRPARWESEDSRSEERLEQAW